MSIFISEYSENNEQKPSKPRNTTFLTIKSSYATLSPPSLKNKLASGDYLWNHNDSWFPSLRNRVWWFLLCPSHEPPRNNQEFEILCKSKEFLLQDWPWASRHSNTVVGSGRALSSVMAEILRNKGWKWGRGILDSVGIEHLIGQKWGNKTLVKQGLVLLLL